MSALRGLLLAGGRAGVALGLAEGAGAVGGCGSEGRQRSRPLHVTAASCEWPGLGGRSADWRREAGGRDRKWGVGRVARSGQGARRDGAGSEPPEG